MSFYRNILTSERRGSSEAAAYIHGGDGVPNAVFIGCVVQALHGAEPRPAVVAPDHVNPVVQGHRGYVASFTCNILLKTSASLRQTQEEDKHT